MNIISLLPSATEIIHSLGCSDMLVGISHECDYPPEIKGLPICSNPRFNTDGSSLKIDNTIKSLIQQALSIYEIDESLMAKLKPDLIVTQSQCEVCAVNLKDVERALKNNLNISPTIISLKPNTLKDVWKDIENIGRLLGKEKLASSMLGHIEESINEIENQSHHKTFKRIACIEWIEPLMFAGNWVPEIVQKVGGRDVFGLSGKHSKWSKYEILFDENPDKIIFMPCGYEINKTYSEIKSLIKLAKWKKLKAFQTGEMYIVDGSQYFNRPGPRLLDSIKIMDEIINDGISHGYHGRGWMKFD